MREERSWPLNTSWHSTTGVSGTSAHKPALEELGAAGRDFTAVIAARDEIAVPALRVFRRHEINVLQDGSLVGYDDRPLWATSHRP